MQMRGLLAAVVLAVPLYSGPVRQKLPTALPNSNTEPAGALRAGVLRIGLEARLTMWHPDGDSLPGIPVEAFAERGKQPRVPGPLIRVPAGTEIRASVRNSLERDTVTFYLPTSATTDSVVIPPGQRRELRVKAAVPGTFLYRATTSTPLSRQLGLGGLLAGAVVVDSVGSAARDRVFVLLGAADSADAALGFPIPERTVRAINGRSWPHTERLHTTVGDTVRWRVINAGNDVHPMHLHGFYFRVDALEGPRVAAQGQGPSGRWVVTERLSQFAAMSITWVPERAGNWLFHCHFQKHVMPHGPLNIVGPNGVRQRIASSSSAPPSHRHASHAAAAMAGLAVGVEVRPRAGERIAEPPRGRRLLRLVATRDAGFPDSVPSMRYVPDAPSPARRAGRRPVISPTIYLTRGEPVSITVVNQLQEPTAVHWHGIELESYFDGVAGFSGSAARLTPIIAPGDSFEARFTPPRSGTFIYHSHVDEVRQHRAGLVGALVVRDSAPRDSTEDLVFFLKSARAESDPEDAVPLEINGMTDPDTTVLKVGRTYRMRVIGMQVRVPLATVRLTARPDSSFLNLSDSLVVQWRPVAKDGADLPPAFRVPRRAEQIVTMGETYDYEVIPAQRGELRLEVRQAGPRGRLMVRAPIRVE